jgi:hypothetical protein
LVPKDPNIAITRRKKQPRDSKMADIVEVNELDSRLTNLETQMAHMSLNMSHLTISMFKMNHNIVILTITMFSKKKKHELTNELSSSSTEET